MSLSLPSLPFDHLCPFYSDQHPQHYYHDHQALQPLLAKTVGCGIYDPQASGDPYVQLNLSGKLSLLFPRGVNAARNPSRHVLTMEWEGKQMRFQVDRRFAELTDGRIKSLELTEVQAAKAEKYPPGFAIKPDYMQ